MTTVQVYYEELEFIATRLLNRFSSLYDTRVKLMTQLYELANGGWSGRAAERFYDEMFYSVMPAVQRLEVALEETARHLRLACDILHQAEYEGEHLFNRGDVIPPMSVKAQEPPSQRELLLERVKDALLARIKLDKGLLGLFNNSFGAGWGIADLMERLPGRLKWLEFVGYGLQLWESGLQDGNTLENLSEGVVQILTELGVEAGLNYATLGLGTIALVINDFTQVAGTINSGISSFIHDINPDPALADAIKHFNTTLENADFGSVTGSFSSVVIDVMQLTHAGIGRTDDPFSSALSHSTPFLAGLLRRPDLAQELGHNGLTFVGSVIDFGLGVGMLEEATVEMNAQTVRVGTHALGQFFNLDPDLNRRLSDYAGQAYETPMDIISTIKNPMTYGMVNFQRDYLQPQLQEFAGHYGITLPTIPTPDFSTWLGGLIPKPN